jgi:hypothetical protein
VNTKNNKFNIFPNEMADGSRNLTSVDAFVYFIISSNYGSIDNKNIVAPKQILDELGRKPRSGDGNINNEIITSANTVIERYSSSNVKIKNIGDVKFINKLTIPDGEGFSRLRHDAFHKIMNADKSILYNSAIKLRALNIFLHIVSNIFERGTDIHVGGTAETCRDTYKELSFKFNINKATVSKYVHKLYALDVLASNLGDPIYYAKKNEDDRWNRAKTVYVVKKDGWEEELSQGVKQYRYSLEKFGYKTIVRKHHLTNDFK